jgi:acyl carrier protein
MNNILSAPDKQAVLDILVEQLGARREQLVPGAKIQADFSADSLTMIEIAMAMEEQFNLSISDEQWEEVVTVGDLFEVLSKALASRPVQKAKTGQ